MASNTRLTARQIEENQAQQSRFVFQQRLVGRWQAQIGITDITQLGTKQLRDKSKELGIAAWKQANKRKRQAMRQQQRQKRNQAILLIKQRQDQVSTSGQANNVGCNIVVNDPTLG